VTSADGQSLFFTLVERAWQIPMEDYFGNGGSFEGALLKSRRFPVIMVSQLLHDSCRGARHGGKTEDGDADEQSVQAILGTPGLPPFLILWIIRECCGLSQLTRSEHL
jgi:hypothetical protein